MYISVRFGRTRVGGGCLFWLFCGPVWLATALMMYSLAGMVYGLWCGLRLPVRMLIRRLTAGQIP